MSKREKYQGVANPAYAQGMREIRQSNKAGTHAQGTARERTRRDAKRAAIRDNY